jgi:predicted nucleic acid-binding protein
MTPLVLDSEAVSALAAPHPQRPAEAVRALARSAWELGRPVVVPAVVCAETCRGEPRTRSVEALLARHRVGGVSPINVVDTTFRLARRVGSVLHASSRSSADMVDAHLVALCVEAGGGIVVTTDPDDVMALAAPFPGLRVLTRSPHE